MAPPRHTLPTTRLPRLPARLVDGLVAVALLGITVAELLGPVESGARSSTTLAYLLAACFTLPYAAHRDHPVVVTLVASTSVVAYAAGHFTGYPGYSVFVLVFGLALHARQGRGYVYYLVGVVTLGTALALQPAQVVNTSTWFSTMLVLTVAWLAGENLRARRARWSALEERALRLEAEREERARQAVAEERLRIARDLHDVVAHSMSVVAVQAGVADHVLDSRPELAGQALAAIETTSRSALVELRRMLGVLRTPGEGGPAALEPSAGLADLPALIASFGDAGLRVSLQLEGDPEQVPPGVSLSAYRVAQESLTNVLKHGGDSARLSVACTVTAVSVDVHDPGRADAAPSLPGAGQGLLGMRERVAVFGGRMSAGPDAEGGFRLVATFPLDQTAQQDRTVIRTPQDAQ